MGMQSVVWNEAVKVNGADPDYHRRDLWDAIQMGDFPEWELGLQLFDEQFANAFDFDVLDSTKIIPEEVLPVRRVGRLVLDRVVDNFFAETEQVAFCTQNIVPGIDFTDDPLLQGRNFSYLDTQLKRLGSPNFHEIPVNSPRGCPFHNFQQDGHMRMTVPKGRAMYQPNSFGEGPRELPTKGFRSYPAEVSGPKLRIRAESFADHYSQARQFYLSQTDVEQGHIAAALTFELSKVETLAIRARVVAHLRNIDEGLAQKVAQGLRLKALPEPAPAARPTKDLEKSPALSIILNGPASFAGRKVGALVTDGADAKLLDALKAALKKEGALLKLVAPNVGGIEASDGSFLEADEKVDGGPVGAVRRRRAAALGAGRDDARQGPRGARLRRRRVRASQVHRLCRRRPAPAQEGRRVRGPRRRLPAVRDRGRRQELRPDLPQAALLAARDRDQARLS